MSATQLHATSGGLQALLQMGYGGTFQEQFLCLWALSSVLVLICDKMLP